MHTCTFLHLHVDNGTNKQFENTIYQFQLIPLIRNKTQITVSVLFAPLSALFLLIYSVLSTDNLRGNKTVTTMKRFMSDQFCFLNLL